MNHKIGSDQRRLVDSFLLVVDKHKLTVFYLWSIQLGCDKLFLRPKWVFCSTRGLCLVLFSNLRMGDPFTKTSDFTVDLFKDAMVQVMCY